MKEISKLAEKVKQLANENLTKEEVKALLYEKYGIDIHMTTLHSYYSAYKLKYKQLDGNKRYYKNREIISIQDAILKAYEQNSNCTMDELVEEASNIAGYEINKKQAYRVTRKYNLEYKRIPINERPLMNKTKSNEKVKAKSTILDLLTNICNQNPDLTLKEIYNKVCEILPTPPSKNTLYTYLSTHKLPYKRITNGPGGKYIKNEIKEEIQDVENKLEQIDNSEVQENTIVQNNDIQIIEKDDNNFTHILNMNNIPEDAVNEVSRVLQAKAEKLQCIPARNYTTEFYIDILDALYYLVSNLSELKRTRLDLQDITDNYEIDIVHENELVDLDDGDTYIQDKQKALRRFRRYFKHDYEDLQVLEEFLKSINKHRLNETINKLKSKQISRRDMKYIPRVDVDMVRKYDWCTDGTPYSRVVNTPILKTATTQINKKYNELPTYRVTCQTSGGGTGLFRPWSRTLKAKDEQDAINQCLNVLNVTKSKFNGNYMWTDIRATKVNE